MRWYIVYFVRLFALHSGMGRAVLFAVGIMYLAAAHVEKFLGGLGRERERIISTLAENNTPRDLRQRRMGASRFPTARPNPRSFGTRVSRKSRSVLAANRWVAQAPKRRHNINDEVCLVIRKGGRQGEMRSSTPDRAARICV